MVSGSRGDFFFWFVYFGPKYSAKKKSVHTLVNFLSGSAKLAIWLTCRNRAQSGTGLRVSVRVEPVLVLKGLLKARLRVEHTYYGSPDCLPQGLKALFHHSFQLDYHCVEEHNAGCD